MKNTNIAQIVRNNEGGPYLTYEDLGITQEADFFQILDSLAKVTEKIAIQLSQNFNWTGTIQVAFPVINTHLFTIEIS